MGMHWLDIGIIAIVALSVITGLVRGFVKELVALLVWVIALWMGYQYSSILDSHLSGWIADKKFRYLAGFVIIMLSVLVAGGIFNAIFGLIMKKSGLSSVDRILGMGFGFARGVFIASLGLVVLQMTSLSREDQVKDSRLMVALNPMVNWMSLKVPLLMTQIKRLDPDETLNANLSELSAAESPLISMVPQG